MSTSAPDEVIQVGQIEIRFRLTAPQTSGQLTMFEYRIPSGARVPMPHSHEAFDETAYGLDGVTTITLDGHEVAVRPGDVLFIPRGVVHKVENRGPVEARGISVNTPGLFGPEYFREMSAILNAGGPPNVQRIVEVMQRHGLRPASV
jgi:quercetin dioxygenase-like cupin family protein